MSHNIRCHVENGNSLFRSQKWDSAISEYRRSLRLLHPLPSPPKRVDHPPPFRPFLLSSMLHLRIGAALASKGKGYFLGSVGECIVALKIIECSIPAELRMKNAQVETMIVTALVRMLILLQQIVFVSREDVEVFSKAKMWLQRIKRGRNLTFRDPLCLNLGSKKNLRMCCGFSSAPTFRRPRRKQVVRICGRRKLLRVRIRAHRDSLLDRLLRATEDINPESVPPMESPGNDARSVLEVCCPSSRRPSTLTSRALKQQIRRLQGVFRPLQEDIKVLFCDLGCRGVFARRDFEPGETIVVETMSFVVSLAESVCDYCGRKVVPREEDSTHHVVCPCGNLYCSNECAEFARRLYHEKVCSLRRLYSDNDSSPSPPSPAVSTLIDLAVEKLYAAIIQKNPATSCPLSAVSLPFDGCFSDAFNTAEALKSFQRILSCHWILYSPFLSFRTTAKMLELVARARSSYGTSSCGLSTFLLLCSQSPNSNLRVQCNEKVPQCLSFTTSRRIAQGEELFVAETVGIPQGCESRRSEENEEATDGRCLSPVEEGGSVT